MEEFLNTLDGMIASRKKMTSPLYQTILAGKAPKSLLQQFVIHRFPIKNLWTRNILGIASRIDDYHLRSELVENIYEEETGRLTNSRRHLETFVSFGESLGLSREIITNTPPMPETQAIMDHNVRVCNSSDVHFTAGVASVLLLMEGQPPIISQGGSSMETVMRDVYGLPPWGYEFFTHHASNASETEGVSDLEDDHASTAREILRRYCTTEELQQQAVDCLDRAITLRHKHFDAIHERFYDAGEQPFRWKEAASAA